MTDEHPCWCGSGTPFASCHTGREASARVPRSELLAYFKRERARAVCLHFDANPITCSPRKIRAHSIQRRRGLDRIARGGQVYQFTGDYGDLLRHGGRITAKLIGVQRATTFGGFCARHDNDLFAPIDTQAFEAREDLAVLLLYRALCREVWVRDIAERSIAFFRQLDRGRPLEEQRAIQAFLNLHEEGLRNGNRSLARHKRALDQCLRSGRVEDIRFLVFSSGTQPNVLCSGVFYPTHDFQGRELQDLSLADRPLDLLSMSAIATADGHATVLAWHASSDSVCIRFIQSLSSCPDPEREVPEAILRLMLSSFENVAIRPDWWEGLGEDVRTELLARFQFIGHPLTPPDPQYLMPDRGAYLADPVTAVQTNVPPAR